MRLLDLFSGIGGFSLAAEWAGIETVAFCERDKFCQKVLKKHWLAVPIHDDIKTLKGFPVDIITAGFPCQPFSVAGKKKGIHDDRYLWPDTIRIIRESHPTWCILENVPGIIPMLDPIFEDLEREGYTWKAYLIPASILAAPHKRERLWIIAHRDSQRFNERGDNRCERHFQIDWQSHIAAIQSEWSQFQPQSWTTFNAQEWLGITADSTSERSQRERQSQQSLYSAQDSEREAGDAVDDTNNTESISNAISEPDPQADSGISSQRSRRQSWSPNTGKHWSDSADFGWEEDQPPIPGVDDGLPNGLDRNKSLGNSIVPQIPYLFMRIILEIEKGKSQ